VQFLSAQKARTATFDCEGWAELGPNTSRNGISAGGFVHDIYAVSFAGDFERATEALFSYRIFAPHRMYARVCTPDLQVAEGGTIVQRVVLGPVAIETAVRVIEVESIPDRAFFAYSTLQGHAERGIASFAVTRNGSQVTFQTQAWSRAGNWLTLLGRPVSRTLQRRLTKEAVASFAASVGQ
jgi:uncharacterized protein (UPF0548 family)